MAGALARKAVIYAAGLLAMAFGVALSVNSGLGVSPVNSLPYVASLILRVDMGSCVVGIFTLYVLIQIVICRRDFSWINLTQIFFSTLFGYFVDFAKAAVGDFTLPTYAGQLALLLTSMVFVAFGVCLYMDAGLVNMPMEGMTKAVAERVLKNKPFHDVKVMMDCGAVALALLLSVVFLGEIQGIREGTLLCALMVGKLMKPMQRVLKPWTEAMIGAVDMAGAPKEEAGFQEGAVTDE